MAPPRRRDTRLPARKLPPPTTDILFPRPNVKFPDGIRIGEIEARLSSGAVGILNGMGMGLRSNNPGRIVLGRLLWAATGLPYDIAYVRLPDKPHSSTVIRTTNNFLGVFRSRLAGTTLEDFTNTAVLEPGMQSELFCARSGLVTALVQTGILEVRTPASRRIYDPTFMLPRVALGLRQGVIKGLQPRTDAGYSRGNGSFAQQIEAIRISIMPDYPEIDWWCRPVDVVGGYVGLRNAADYTPGGA